MAEAKLGGAVGGEPLEAGDVGAGRVDVQPVAAGRRLDRVAGGGERLAQPHHVGLHRLGRARRGIVAPHRVDQRLEPARRARAGRRATPTGVGAADRRRATAARRTRPASSRAGTREVPASWTCSWPSDRRSRRTSSAISLITAATGCISVALPPEPTLTDPAPPACSRIAPARGPSSTGGADRGPQRRSTRERHREVPMDASKTARSTALGRVSRPVRVVLAAAGFAVISTAVPAWSPATALAPPSSTIAPTSAGGAPRDAERLTMVPAERGGSAKFSPPAPPHTRPSARAGRRRR